MALIHEINGSLLLNLAGTDTSSARSSGSSVGGQGARASFDSDPISLREGLVKGASLFAESIVRLDDAISDTGTAKQVLTELAELSSKMVDLAEAAADIQTSDADRVKYNSQLSSLAAEFVDVQEKADIEDEDLLDKSDLRVQLKESGIDLDAATALASAFTQAGGSDDTLGYEKYVKPNGTPVNPLNSSLSTYDDAVIAHEALKELDAHVQYDLEQVSLVLDELKSARAFAFYGFSAFDDASAGRINTSNPEEMASEITSSIRENASDSSLAAHSDLDSKLVQKLLEFQPENSYL